jgi:hypothetical protein
MSDQEARELIARNQRLAERARAERHATSYPLILLGTLALSGVLVGAIGLPFYSPPFVIGISNLWWAVAGTAGIFTIAWLQRRIRLTRGIGAGEFKSSYYNMGLWCLLLALFLPCLVPVGFASLGMPIVSLLVLIASDSPRVSRWATAFIGVGVWVVVSSFLAGASSLLDASDPASWIPSPGWMTLLGMAPVIALGSAVLVAGVRARRQEKELIAA